MPADVTESDGPVTELGQTGAMLLAELEAAYDAKAEAEARIEVANNAVKLLMGDHTHALAGGQPIAIWKPVHGKRFDAQTAKRFLTPEQIDAATVEVESRPFKRVQA